MSDFALAPNEQVALLRIALRVKLKREGLPADALTLVATDPSECRQDPLTAEVESVT